MVAWEDIFWEHVDKDTAVAALWKIHLHYVQVISSSGAQVFHDLQKERGFRWKGIEFNNDDIDEQYAFDINN
jgi:hypothetical protein